MAPPQAVRTPSPQSESTDTADKPKEWQMDFCDDSVQSQSQTTFLGNLRRAIMGPRGAQIGYKYYAAPLDDDDESSAFEGLLGKKPTRPQQTVHYAGVWRRLKWFTYRLPLFTVFFFGIIHLIVVVYGRKPLFWDDHKTDHEPLDWAEDVERLLHYATDPTRDVRPLPCHSHNDYWRRLPLFDALHAGCTSVEADVWLYDGNDDLLVGHSTASLTASRTLRNLYVAPLMELLEQMNPTTEFGTTEGHGIFDEEPSQTLVLLIDFKTDGHKLFPRVQEGLEPLREKGYLSHWNGEKFISRAITVVGTGNTPFDLIIENQSYRDIFFDAPLDQMYEPPSADGDVAPQPLVGKTRRGQGKTGTDRLTADAFNASNSYFASVSMTAAGLIPWTGRLSGSQLESVRGQIRGAQRRGLKARYWETPEWPVSLRNYIWKTLVHEGVGTLNLDHLTAGTSFDWDNVGHDWVNG